MVEGNKEYLYVGNIHIYVMLLLLQVGNEIILAKDDINVFFKVTKISILHTAGRERKFLVDVKKDICAERFKACPFLARSLIFIFILKRG